jgi:hypothetical protein
LTHSRSKSPAQLDPRLGRISSGGIMIIDESDDWHRRLLRARCDRPPRRYAAEKRDERATFHSITSSARASNVGGTVQGVRGQAAKAP